VSYFAIVSNVTGVGNICISNVIVALKNMCQLSRLRFLSRKSKERLRFFFAKIFHVDVTKFKLYA